MRKPSASKVHKNGKKPHDRLYERLKQDKALEDPALQGAANILSTIEKELKSVGVSEEDRGEIKELVARELVYGILAGRRYE